MIEQGITSLLQNDAPLMALVNHCVYPVLLPESSSYPCLSYQVVSGNSSYALGGEVQTSKRIQFDAWATTYADVKSVQAAVRRILDAYCGTLSDGTVVLGTFRGVEFDEFASDARVYRAISEYWFQFVEP